MLSNNFLSSNSLRIIIISLVITVEIRLQDLDLKKWFNPFFLRRILISKLIKLINKNNGFYIFSEPWDNLILLDACRYDFFKKKYKEYDLSGKLEKRVSRGSHTTTFLRENFIKNRYDNIIYITANPYVNKILGDRFYKIISVWKDGWNEKYHTVLPQTMYKRALDTIIKYPEKKFIIHFIQPHYPYIGVKLGTKYLENLKDSVEQDRERKFSKEYRDKLFTLYGVDIYRRIDKETHLRLYERNLELVLPYVKKLVDTLKGRTIVSSDHGEAFGEIIHPLLPFKIYGHNAKFRIPALNDIPWLVVEEKLKNHKKLNETKEKTKIVETINKLVF